MRAHLPMAGIAALIVASGVAVPAHAQAPIPIRDNSFLIEEAYNQEWGVVQHVGTYQRMRGAGGWGATFTQEWPVPSERHQLSYTVPFDRTDGGKLTVRNVAINYRYQIPFRAGAAHAVAPRLTFLTPLSGGRSVADPDRGVEVNLPVSVELSRLLVTHFNVGATWFGNGATLSSPTESFVGGSAIVLLHPKFNFMVEALLTEPGGTFAAGADSEEGTFHIAPGFRGAIDFPSGLQVVPGVAFPIGVGRSDGEKGVYVYLSFEHPFRRR